MNNLFFLVKGFIKKLVRYCFSFYWFFRIKLRNHGGSTNSAIKKNLGNVVDVHLICPGPGIRKINEMKIDDKTLLIFVNHAVEVSCDDKFKNVPKIAFSADPVRALEILEQRKEKLSCCTSILLPGHLFQMNYKIQIIK